MYVEGALRIKGISPVNYIKRGKNHMVEGNELFGGGFLLEAAYVLWHISTGK